MDSSGLKDIDSGLDSLRKTWGSMLEDLTNKKGEPQIKVTIKPRAKVHMSDEFKLNVNYEIDWAEQDKQKL